MQNAPSAAPLPALLGLGLAVLVLHLWLLQGWGGQPPVTPLARPLVLRALPATPPPVVTTPSRPRPARPPAPPAKPEAAPALAESATPEAAIPAPATEASATAEVPATPAAPPAPPPVAYAVPGSVKLLYNVTGHVGGFNYYASAELLWRHDGQAYDARLQVGAFLLGSRVQTSRGQITPEGLAPKRFGDKVRSEVAAHFERDKGKIIFSANTPEIPLQAGAQDHLSVFMQLASLIAGDPQRYPPGSSIEMQAVGPRDAAQWRITVDGPETLQLPGGEQATLKLTRPPTHPYDLKAELWLAPALDWLPARIRLTQNNGDSVDQQWRASEQPEP